MSLKDKKGVLPINAKQRNGLSTCRCCLSVFEGDRVRVLHPEVAGRECLISYIYIYIYILTYIRYRCLRLPRYLVWIRDLFASSPPLGYWVGLERVNA